MNSEGIVNSEGIAFVEEGFSDAGWCCLPFLFGHSCKNVNLISVFNVHG